jgi:antitoxin component of RelBE/YafQ-DinJ toxin-antitoxin module
MDKQQFIHIRIPKGLKDRAQAAADMRGETLSDMVRKHLERVSRKTLGKDGRK